MNTAISREEGDLIDRYLNDKLKGEELAAFEIRMMDDSILFEEVQQADALKQALRREQATLLQDSGSGAEVLPFNAWFRQPLSLAASALVAMAGLHFAWSEFLVPASSPTDAAPVASGSASLGIGAVLLLENSRGDTPLQFNGTPPYLFQIDVGLGNDADAFSVGLLDVKKQQLMRVVGLKADADGWVRVVLNQALAGDYQLDLQWVDRTGAVQSRVFPIKVVP